MPSPWESISNIILHPVVGLHLLLQKLWLDFRLFFFGGHPGSFDLLFVIRNSLFSGNLLFYAYVATAIGIWAILGTGIWRPSSSRWERTILVTTILSYSLTYIVLFVGMTRFRATIHPLLLLFTALGVTRGAQFLRHRLQERRSGDCALT